MPKRKGNKKYTRQHFKTKSDWLGERVIGGSSASAIVNMNPWLSPMELYEQLKRGKKPDIDNEVLRYGREAEPLIRKMFALDFPDIKVIPPKGYEIYRRKDKPYMTATVDGKTVDAEGRKGVLEIKTHEVRNKEDFAEWSGSIPKNYLIQVLHYLLVLNDYEYADLVAKLKFFDYDGKIRKLARSEIRYYHIERSDVEKELKWLEKAEETFWEEHIQKNTPPAVEISF